MNHQENRCPECGTPLDQVPLRECATHRAQDEVQAPAPDHILDLHQRVATIIRKGYFVHTRNEKLAHETAMAVLEEVHRTYEQIAAGAAAEEQATN